MPKKASSDTTEFKAMLTAVREATSVEGGQEEGRRSPPAVPRTRRARAEERGGMPLLLNYAVVVGGSRGVGVDRGQGTGALDELDELVVVAVDPLLAERAGQC